MFELYTRKKIPKQNKYPPIELLVVKIYIKNFTDDQT